jgi:hypothetical protein
VCVAASPRATFGIDILGDVARPGVDRVVAEDLMSRPDR